MNTYNVQCFSQDNVVYDGSLESDGISPQNSEEGSGNVDHFEVRSGLSFLCVICLEILGLNFVRFIKLQVATLPINLQADILWIEYR